MWPFDILKKRREQEAREASRQAKARVEYMHNKLTQCARPSVLERNESILVTFDDPWSPSPWVLGIVSDDTPHQSRSIYSSSFDSGGSHSSSSSSCSSSSDSGSSDSGSSSCGSD